MRRLLLCAILAGVVVVGAGCGSKGEEIADKVNEQVVAKIESGEVKTLPEAELISLGVRLDIFTEMDKNAETITRADERAMKKKLEAYKKEWKKALDAKYTQ